MNTTLNPSDSKKTPHSIPTSVPQSYNFVQKARWPGLMSLSTLAEYLDMSTTTVANLVKAGRLPAPVSSPTPRLKRWSKKNIEDHFYRISDDKHSSPSIDQLMAKSFSKSKGGC